MTSYKFELPDPGEGLTEAELVEWHVDEGDSIEEHDVLCEVETDKAVTDIPSPCPGTIEKRQADPGDIVQVGEVLVVIETDSPPSGEDEAEAAEEAAEEADTGEGEPENEEAEKTEGTTETSEQESEAEEPEEAEGTEEERKETEAEETEAEQDSATEETAVEQESEAEVQAEQEADAGTEGVESQSPATTEDRVFAAPRTRAYAREQGVALSTIDGTGPNGRVLREDINVHLSDRPTGEAAGGSAGEAAYSLKHPTTEIEPVAIDEDEERSERRDLSGLRGRIAENMSRSTAVVPQLTSGFKADATELADLKERLDEKHDVNITYTPILLKAVVPALKEFPIVNASIDDTTDEIVEKHYYNVGFATHTEGGLMVPVIRNIDSKSIVEVAREMTDLAEQARERSIDVTDMQGGTFTVTNLATFGEHRTFGTPIINYPEAAIMGIGRVRTEAVATEDDDVEVRPQINLSLSYDHRIIDGAKANQFMEYIIDGIEDTDILLARL